MYQPIAESAGIASVMWVQVALCLLGVIVSFYLLTELSPRAKKIERVSLEDEMKEELLG